MSRFTAPALGRAAAPGVQDPEALAAPWLFDVFDIAAIDIYDVLMRTTLTIADDVAAQIEEIRRRERLSLKRVIDFLLREGLRRQSRPPEAREYSSKTHELRLRAGYDAERLNQLVDELEAEDHRNRDAVPPRP